MTLHDTMQAVASALLDAIRDTADGDAVEPPAEAHTDLACRFVLRLQRQGVTVLPTDKAAVARAQQSAAQRTLDALTRWLHEHPGCCYVTELAPSGRIEVTFLERDDEVRAFVAGSTAQDAYAQAAQALILDGGAL